MQIDRYHDRCLLILQNRKTRRIITGQEAMCIECNGNFLLANIRRKPDRLRLCRQPGDVHLSSQFNLIQPKGLSLEAYILPGDADGAEAAEEM